MRDGDVKRVLLHVVPFSTCVFDQPPITFQIDEKLKFLESVSAHVIVIYNNIFRLQKRVIRIITNIRRRDSCREQIKKLQILPLQSQNILALLLFVINSSDMFEHDCEIHTVNIRNRTRSTIL